MFHKSKTEEEKLSAAKKASVKRQQKIKASMRKINSNHGDDLKRLAE